MNLVIIPIKQIFIIDLLPGNRQLLWSLNYNGQGGRSVLAIFTGGGFIIGVQWTVIHL